MQRNPVVARVAAALAAIFLLLPEAGANPEAERPPLLVVTGAIAGGRAEFDLAALESMGAATVVTSTPWTNGKETFEGVLMRDLLAHLGATGSAVTVVARNDYKMTIPSEDFAKYRVVLAWRMNGELLRVRDKGPLWIVYPQDDYPELRNKPTQAKWVWQIKEMRVE